MDTITICRESARQVRRDVLQILNKTRDSHIGTDYSAADILSVLYNAVLKVDTADPARASRDLFFMSKGHGALAVYCTLAHRGFFPVSLLNTYIQNGSDLAGHIRRFVVPGVEFSSGSLGHGLSTGLGAAYANRLHGNPGRVFVLMGDGECNEGSVWEAAMFGAKHKITNCIGIVDRNMFQSYGSDEQVLNMGDLGAKFRAFGWEVADIDGHDYRQLIDTLSVDPQSLEKPLMVIAHTIKGKGISFMENRLEWHFKSPNDEQTRLGLEELAK